MISNVHLFFSLQVVHNVNVWYETNITAKLDEQHNISGAEVQLKKHIVKILHESR